MKKAERIFLSVAVMIAAAIGTCIYLKTGLDSYIEVQMENVVLYSIAYMCDHIFFVLSGVMLFIYGGFQIGNSNAWFSSLIIPSVTVFNTIAAVGYSVYRIINYTLMPSQESKIAVIASLVYLAAMIICLIFTLADRLNGLTVKISSGIMALSALFFSEGKIIITLSIFACFLFNSVLTYTDRENGRDDNKPKANIY